MQFMWLHVCVCVCGGGGGGGVCQSYCHEPFVMYLFHSFCELMCVETVL